MRLYIFLLCTILFLVCSKSGFSQYEENARVVISFDDAWSFKKDITGWTWRYKYDHSYWEKVNLPHDWSIYGPFNKEEPSGGYGAYLPTGTGVYRKHFTLPESFNGKSISIEFDGVYMNSEVYCNGVWLGKRPNGYMGFSYDLTPYLKFGDFENIISVLVDNSTQINCRWYTGSGIYRHVRLVAKDKLHIPQWGTFITTPVIEKNSAIVNVKTTINNSYPENKSFFVKTAIYNEAGKCVSEEMIPAELNANDEIITNINLSIKNPSLWSVNSPVLYSARSEIICEGKVLDEYLTTFGIRKIHFDADKGFFLNDVNIKIKGVCLHHDGGSVGAAVPEQVLERRLRLLKDMGCNAIRTSHNPFSPEFFDLCDKMGFLVMDEFFDEWKINTLPDVTMGYNLIWDEWWKTDLVDGIKRDRNHPSIFIYSAGNEIIEQNRPWGEKMAREIVDVYHQMDPSRCVTSGNNMMPEANMTGFADVFDVVGYNYGIQFDMYELDRKNYPDRKFIGTENTRGKSTRGVYVLPVPEESKLARSSEGYTSSYDYLFRKYGMENEWKQTKSLDYVAGLFLWPGIDYLGEENWPKITVDNGPMDRCAFPKDAYYFYQSQWTDKPVLHLLPHWNWEGKEGESIPVWCYSNCDEVELSLNGKSLGKKDFSSSNKLHLEWIVAYQPGELKAVGYKDGKKMIEEKNLTAGEPYRINVERDRTHINANGTDVIHLKISVVDENDIEIPSSDEKIKISISGPAKLLALDNGDPLFKGSFQASEINLFNGLALAIIQSNKEKGRILIHIEGDKKLKTEALIIESL